MVNKLYANQITKENNWAKTCFTAVWNITDIDNHVWSWNSRLFSNRKELFERWIQWKPRELTANEQKPHRISWDMGFYANNRKFYEEDKLFLLLILYKCRQFECCGKNSSENWRPILADDYLPASCCQQQATNITDSCIKEDAAPIGCETILIELFNKIFTISIEAGLIVCTFQVSTKLKPKNWFYIWKYFSTRFFPVKIITIALMFWLYGDLHRLSHIEAENARNANNVEVSDLVFRLMTNNSVMKYWFRIIFIGIYINFSLWHYLRNILFSELFLC